VRVSAKAPRAIQANSCVLLPSSRLHVLNACWSMIGVGYEKEFFAPSSRHPYAVALAPQPSGAAAMLPCVSTVAEDSQARADKQRY
jgi:hypothetical protein